MKKGLTFVEVLVSSIILASVLAGVIATFVSTRRVVGRSTERVAAANLVRQQFDSLYSAVRADSWDGSSLTVNPLADGVHDSADGSEFNLGSGTSTLIDNIQYSANYTVDADPDGDGTDHNSFIEVTTSINFDVPG